MTRLWVMSFFEVRLRTCLKNHSYNLHVPLCGIFCPNSVAVTRYGAFIRTKSPNNCMCEVDINLHAVLQQWLPDAVGNRLRLHNASW